MVTGSGAASGGLLGGRRRSEQPEHSLDHGGRPAETGDFLTIDLVAKVDGEEIDSASGVSYEVGSGQMLEGTDESGLLGLHIKPLMTRLTALMDAADGSANEILKRVKLISVQRRRVEPKLFETIGAALASAAKANDAIVVSSV